MYRISVGSRAHSVSYSIMARLKRPENEFNYSHPSTVEVKDEGSYTTFLLYAFAMCRGQIYLFS